MSRKGFFKSSKKKGSGYAYTNTRVKVKKSFLLKHDEFQRFMKMSLPEIAISLGQGVYKKEIEELGFRFKGVNLLEYALNKNLERTFQIILGFSIEEAKNQIGLYLKRYDVHNLKTIISGKNSKASEEKIINELIACGEFSRQFLEQAVKRAATVNDAMELFKDTEYYNIMKNNIGNIPQMEDELDKYYYTTVLQQAEKELKDYIRFEIWVKNTLNKLRGEKVQIKVQLLPHEKPKKLKALMKEDNVETRVLFKRILVEKGLKMVHGVGRNSKPVIGFFIAKENEVNNIRIIARGKHSNLSEEVVAKQLVV
ncbi:MAG TPA: V-type ATPase subunit [archaeon]|nr:V-type ATPase subunit [archaeon]